jgi:hypothetical protein
METGPAPLTNKKWQVPTWKSSWGFRFELSQKKKAKILALMSGKGLKWAWGWRSRHLAKVNTPWGGGLCPAGRFLPPPSSHLGHTSCIPWVQSPHLQLQTSSVAREGSLCAPLPIPGLEFEPLARSLGLKIGAVKLL